jgi:catechol 2,3-dioxygenase-like lactoylglutathione lyase family enzyme
MDLSHARAIAFLPVSDLDRASAWYQEHLGASPSETDEMGVLFACGDGTSFALYQSEFAGTNQGTAMTLDVDDFDSAIADLRSRGVSFEEYDFEYLTTVDGVATIADGSRAAWFKDLDGNIIAIGVR